MMKGAIFIRLLLWIFFVTIPSATYATEHAVFGPSDFEIGRLHVHLSRHSFSAIPPDDAIVTVTKNTPDLDINFGLIVLNRKFIPLTPFLNSQETLFDQEITLGKANNLTVYLWGQPESRITIKIERVDRPDPTPEIDFSAQPLAVDPGQPSVLAWDTFHSDTVFIDNDIGIVPSNGAVTVYPENSTTYTLTASGSSGSSSQSVTITVRGTPEPPSQGSFGKQYHDLVPPDATIASYEAQRFSIITGRVEDRTGQPISDVAITLLDHPEFGTAHTDATGRFSIPVEGGKTLCVVYAKENMLESHRSVYVPWNDVAIADSIQMIEEDPESTFIAFDGNPDTVVTHQSSLTMDEHGLRSCSLVFSGDTQAYLVEENGNDVYALSAINVRATEYPTPGSMPARLPPNSAFTYCVELSVDGVRDVRFTKPVTIWVHNFLGFDVGEVIPVGFYNRNRGVWEPSNNGVVVRLLDTNEDTIVDALDIDGDDQPDDLNSNGFFLDEVKGLENGQQYMPGATFWRAETSHFTPCDLNLPQGAPADAAWPNPPSPPLADTENDQGSPCTSQVSSFIEERSRVFYEDMPIPGTDLALVYSSSRVQGHQTVIKVPASGGGIPSSLKRIVVRLNVAGRSFSRDLDPLPDQLAEFFWDGMDHLGRSLQTPVAAHIAIGFVYDALYYRPGDYQQAFGQPGIAPTDVPGRDEIILWEKNDIPVSPARSKGTTGFAEGWSLSSHHHMNLQDLSTLHKGDGMAIRNNVRVISKYAGTGVNGCRGIGGPATTAELGYPNRLAVDGSGNVFVGMGLYGVIYKIDTTGIIDSVTGRYQDWGFSGDGGPATEARIDDCGGLAVDRFGNIYFSDTGNFCIRKIDENGIINTIAGVPGSSGYSGDGGPASLAMLSLPRGVAVDEVGNIYIADSGSDSIRKIDTNGIMTTIAGGNGQGYSGNGGLAIDAQLNRPSGIAVDQAGNIYITENYTAAHIIRRIDTTGIISVFAGTGRQGFDGDGGPATEALIFYPEDVAVDTVGNVYIADDSNNRIRMVNPNGIITTVAGSGIYDFDSITGPAALGKLRHPCGVAVDDKGSIYIADNRNHLVKKVFHPSAFTKQIMSGSNVFSENTQQGHVISIDGLHRQTIDLDTGIALYTHQYDEDNDLVAITDRFGSVTEIVRDTDGKPTAIISPEGVTTSLTVDADNHLTRIDYPDESYYTFEYDTTGLLTAKVDPMGNRFEHLFDENGRITNASDPAGGNWAFDKSTQSNGDILTEIHTAEGNVTAYLDATDLSGTYTANITSPAGDETVFHQSSDGLTSEKTSPCGMHFVTSYDLDPVYYHKLANKWVERTPSGLERTFTRNRAYEDLDGDNISDIITETLSINEKVTSIQNSTLSSQKTVTSPEGRIETILYDPLTLLPENQSISGRYDTRYSYDSKGRLVSISAGTRESSATYNAQGNLETITDGENLTTQYTYDTAGRITRIDRPDNSCIGFTYDGNGNLTAFSNPVDVEHFFNYNAVNLETLYQTPSSGSYSLEYNGDRQLVCVNFPSGKQINHIYDAARLIQIQTPEGSVEFTYLCGGRIASLSNGTESITYDYDGTLLETETTSGTVDQSLAYQYDDDFNVAAFSYAGETAAYSYDDDGLLTDAGDFTISRNMENGQPEMVSNGTLNLNRAFNGHGEIDEERTWVNGQNVQSWLVERDDNGRIVKKTETVDGTSTELAYTYDTMGRLQSVTQDNVLVAEYGYNANGTRTFETNLLRGIGNRSFSYSNEDHLLTAGSTTYQFDSDGFLLRKTNGSNVTLYRYSSRGELMTVDLPDQTRIEYIHDPMGRRIAKIQNGVLVEKYQWQGLTRLLAVYDGNDNLLTRFDYADGRMPLSMTRFGIKYYLAYDQVGSLKAVADGAGNVVKNIIYDAFGNIISDSDPNFEMPLGFAGGLYDKETGLVRFGFRDYDPDIGRWTAKDPIFFAGGDTDLYGYVLNDPINRTDPFGLLDNPFANLPSFTEAYPNSEFAAPTADIIVGSIEAGAAIVSGVAAGISLIAGPEFWWITIPTAPFSIEAGWDAYGRVMTAIERLGDSAPCQ